MNDKSALLGQLKIDQSARAETRSRGPLIGLGAAAAVVVAIVLWLLLRPAAAIEVQAVSARAGGGSNASASVLDASGYVVARRQATVSSKITGKVVDVLIEEGQHVEQDQVLAHIDDSNVRALLELSRSQLDSARAQLAEVRVQLGDAQRQLRRARELAEKKLVSQQALETAQANADALQARLASTQSGVVVAERNVTVLDRQMEDTVVRAPFAGVITIKNAQPGEMISPLSAGGAGTRTGIGTLVDMDSLEIEVDVNENFINRVQAGQPVTAKLNAYPDWEIPAEVIAVIPTADRSKATVKVRVGFKQRDPRVLPDMGVRASFQQAPSAKTDQPAPAGVIVQADAVQGSGDTGVVFVIVDDHVERRAVKLGGSTADGVRVLSGVAAGEQLAAGDLSRLTDGAKVKVAQ